MNRVIVLHGPNLNLLGKREPEIYGEHTLEQINIELQKLAWQHNIQLACYQHNSEHELIEAIHQAKLDETNSIIFNPAAFTHTSVALRDALLAVEIPFIEVHMSNPHEREEFRQVSYFSDIASGSINGFGHISYLLALNALILNLNNDMAIQYGNSQN